MRKKFSIFFLMGLFSFNAQAQPKKSWIYFDLGDTIVNTKDMKNIKYMKNAKQYIEELKKEGFKIGLITNIPEVWGMDYEQKLQKLKEVVEEGWTEETPFDWSHYDEIILPLKNTEMKPAPTLFLKAIQKAEGCPSAFIGESPKEIVAAQNLGMAAYLFEEKSEDGFIPAERMQDFIYENYQKEYDPDCI